VASHVQFFDLHDREFSGNKGRHERMRTAAQLAAIKAGGGMIAAMLKDDVQDTDLGGKKFNVAYTPLVSQAIADDCRHSSKTWAQALQYGVDTMGARSPWEATSTASPGTSARASGIRRAAAT
jgi:hypothetical protein